jgi:hypothetical protein
MRLVVASRISIQASVPDQGFAQFRQMPDLGNLSFASERSFAWPKQTLQVTLPHCPHLAPPKVSNCLPQMWHFQGMMPCIMSLPEKRLTPIRDDRHHDTQKKKRHFRAKTPSRQGRRKIMLSAAMTQSQGFLSALSAWRGTSFCFMLERSESI